VLALLVAASAMSAGTALAAPEWYSTVTTPEWKVGGVALTEAAATKWKGSVKLTDEYEAGKSLSVECGDTGEGSAGPVAVDEETQWATSGCVTKAGSCGQPTIEAVRLPWHTELSASAGSISDLTTKGSTGAPLLRILCSGIIRDQCEATLSAALKNVTGGVEATFDGAKLKCTLNKSTTGTLEGAQVIETAKGGKLEAATSTVVGKLTGALAVSGSGNVVLEDVKGSMGINCVVNIEGTIEAAGLGTITHYATPSCSGSGLCGSPTTAEAINLPWKTELYESAGVVRERIVSAGSGTPEWRFSCNSGTRTDRCSLNTSLKALNALAGNVETVFDTASSRTTCSLGGSESGVWTGSLVVYHPAGVEAIEVKK
jgi:hypothetical protein